MSKVTRTLIVIAVALLATACRSPRDTFVRTLEEMRSSAASSHMAIDRWETRAVPTHYVVDTLEAAVEDARDGVSHLQTLAGMADNERRQAEDLGKTLISVCQRLRDAVVGEDGARAANERVQLAALEHDLRDLTARVAGHP
jgi:hypothetical protein